MTSAEHSRSGGILLSTVADIFFIEDRGCVIVPGLPYPSATVPVLRRGAAITLRWPDGSEIQTHIRDLEMFKFVSGQPAVPFTPLLLPKTMAKDDVPIGTEVWYFPVTSDTYIGGNNT